MSVYLLGIELRKDHKIGMPPKQANSDELCKDPYVIS